MSENTLQNQLPNSLPEGLTLEGLGVPPMGTPGPDLQGVLKTQNGEFPVVIEVKNTVTKEEVSEAFKKAEKENNFKGILRTDENKLVSCDYIGDSYSAIVDLSETMVNGNMIKVIAWYDNEWAYSCRLAEFCEFVGKQL